ncbi:MAG: 30S ribosome-binding factor RbfA [bacterium]|nr:30S ribosome-binding factor RbfA [bacterium]
MSGSLRVEKLENVLREEISKIIDKDIDLPDDNLLTITRVEISPDVHYADVFVSILGKDPRGVLEVLRKSVYNIQQPLNKKIRRRPVPAIRFRLDEQELRRESIERSLSKIKKNNEI